jgi:hypothetical protein
MKNKKLKKFTPYFHPCKVAAFLLAMGVNSLVRHWVSISKDPKNTREHCNSYTVCKAVHDDAVSLTKMCVHNITVASKNILYIYFG